MKFLRWFGLNWPEILFGLLITSIVVRYIVKSWMP